MSLTAEQIRTDFLEFFREKGHEIVPSASIVPENDPTLMFTNAGMNQFKDVFLGEGSRPYLRAADSQKCLRVSGKHNDLEEVGYDTYHHTLFEMLGNWSFGDYFKKEAIGWAWELLTEKWGLPADRLYATVHAGDAKLGLDPDDEAAGFWRSETGINHEHILYCGSEDNFWMMGDTGPCGPCSEIHVDLRTDAERAETPGRDLVNMDHPMVMEIWNLVFIQYNAQTDGSLKALSAKHVDTGMGFERIVSVLQQTAGSTYDTDLFRPILDQVASLSPIGGLTSYEETGASGEDADRLRIAMRVIADHVRTIAFAIADGVMPGNTGRGYVIRRILRRAVRYGYQTLELHEPFLYKVAGTVVDMMGKQFPELEQSRDYLQRVTKAEEESFLETLGTGLALFERLLPYLKGQAGPVAHDSKAMDLLGKAYGGSDDALRRFQGAAERDEVPGEVAFLLHDTYGFPIDLTQLMAREEGLAVDMAGYDAAMKQQKDRARAAANFKVDQSEADVWTDISTGDEAFVGYDHSRVEGAAVRSVRTVGEDRFELVLDQTPFYAESGGQVGDTGTLQVGDEYIAVLDTVKRAGRVVHVVDRLPAAPDAPVVAQVDTARLARTKKHHSVTHLMHAALREVLGPHVQQKGSLVAPDYLRFDFSHFERVTPEELRAVEQRVNEVIQRNIGLREERAVPFDEAVARGAMALFGEKYGDTVRVITFDPDYSVELCGGIHVDATGEIGLFRFRSEGSVAAGVRRVEALAGADALGYLHGELDELGRVRGQFKSLQRPSDEEVADLIDANKRLEKELDLVRQQALAGQLGAFIDGAVSAGDARVAVGSVGNADMNALRTLGEEMRSRLGDGGVGVLGSSDGEKAYLVVTVADDLVGRGLQAGKVVGTLAKIVGGGGGGRPQLATAGGRDASKLGDALAAAPGVVGEMLG
ncbi:MAG: alanine--tRNA ligase [Rhodothermales bacterium]|nr:alanine--tRNA ligase [Rhodothermales bacterium]MBO6779715.1 alanine--tRNA ligase [Rhodothermales bacterium]